jgi:outer membrane protein
MKQISWIFFVLISSHLIGQQKNTYTLLEAQETALINSEKLKNSDLEIQMAKLKVDETRAIGLPQVNFTGSFNNFLNLPVQVVDASFINPNAPKGETISFRAGTDYNATGSLQVNQLLFNGSYLVGLQVSNFYKDFSVSAKEKTKEDVLFEVTQAYQMVTVAKANLIFMDSIVLITKQLVDKQKNYLDLGMMTQEDMDQLAFSLTNAINTQNNAKIQLENAFSLLKFTMGLKQDLSIDVSEDVETILKNTTIPNSSNGGLSNNISYQLLSKQVRLNEYNLKNKKAANLPTASAYFQQTYNAFRNEFNFFANERWYPQTFWGVQLQIPIFSSGSRWAQIQQAKVEVEKSRNSLNEYGRVLEMQSIQFSNNFKNALNQLELQSSNVKLAKNIYSNAVIKEKIGNGNSIIVAQKYNQLIIAQAQYIGAMMEVFSSKLNIDKLNNSIKK